MMMLDRPPNAGFLIVKTTFEVPPYQDNVLARGIPKLTLSTDHQDVRITEIVASGNTTSLIAARLRKPSLRAEGCWVAICPVHGNDGRALQMMRLENGLVRTSCEAGCCISRILEALGLRIHYSFVEESQHAESCHS